MAELKSTLIKESIYHCVSETNSNDRLAARPRSADAQSISYATRYAAREKSMRELNDDANAAMGTLLALFHSDCNAHRELSSWFEENVTAALPQHDRGRMDYNFRNAWVKFYARYQPNKQVNLATQEMGSFDDEDLSFSDFHGNYIKLIGEMELIGQPPTEAK